MDLFDAKPLVMAHPMRSSELALFGTVKRSVEINPMTSKITQSPCDLVLWHGHIKGLCNDAMAL